MYVDDLNIIGTPEDIEEASSYLMSEFEMKDLGKTKLCLGLQLEHSPDGILVHSRPTSRRCWKDLDLIRHILLRS